MKKLNFIPAIIAAVFISTSAFATTPNYEVWDYDNDPLEEVLEMEVIPEVTLAKPVVVNTLSLDAFPAQDNYLQIMDFRLRFSMCLRIALALWR